MSIEALEPIEIWKNFNDLNEVPRASKKEEQVIQFMMDFGARLGLETTKDDIGNVVIKKPASPGMDGKKTVILQSHLDMVHQKNNSTDFDFATQGIDMIVDGDWVRANGTTLGADNGIGVATIMGLLESDSIPHPPIEALFTIDEETGMTGAKKLDPSNLSGEILLNLDTEDDDELSIGCAGGIDTNTNYTYQPEGLPSDYATFKVNISGLMGGHSGMDIDKGRGNANKLLVRLLYDLSEDLKFRLISFDGGGLRNAIPREAEAVIGVHYDFEGKLNNEIGMLATVLKEELRTVESNLSIDLSPVSGTKMCLREQDQTKIIQALRAVHNGVFRMSPDIAGLVEASSSLARILIQDGSFTSQSLQRSSVESSKDDVAGTIRSVFDIMGCEVSQTGDYPGWQPNMDSAILQLMADLYRKEYNDEPQIKACHAGLECGILLQHMPGLDTVSFGPNIRGAHSPDEKVQISSVQKYWSYFLKTLEAIPAK